MIRLTITDGDGIEREVKIADVVENYVGHYLYMSPSYYRTVFAERQTDTAAYLKLTEAGLQDESALGQQLMQDEFRSRLSPSIPVWPIRFQDTISSLSFVVVVLVIAAGLLAFVVLYNLTNVNISERIREIATIKVLGFYDP